MRRSQWSSLSTGLLLVFLSPAHSALAFEAFPEFGSLTESEQSAFETPADIESEYQSDFLAYQKPMHWQYLWLIHQNKALDLSVGSISAQEFLLDNRLKLRAHLTDSVEFRFTHFEDRNMERDSVHNIMELILWYRQFGAAFYGEPSLNKRENDSGLAFFYKPQPRHEIRFFNTFVDVTRQKRNNRDDKYEEGAVPEARGFVGRLWSNPDGKRPGEFLEYALRYETKTTWIFPTEQYEYRYWRIFYSLFFQRNLWRNLKLGGRVQFDRKWESNNPTDTASTITAESWRNDRLFSTLQTVFTELGPNRNLELTTGIHYAYRHWQTDAARTLQHNFLPHLWLRIPTVLRGDEQDFLDAGYDVGWHRNLGPIGMRAPNEPESAVDHRLNLAYSFSFKAKAELRLMLTFDVDKLGSKKSWQGGDGQFRLYF